MEGRSRPPEEDPLLKKSIDPTVIDHEIEDGIEAARAAGEPNPTFHFINNLIFKLPGGHVRTDWQRLRDLFDEDNDRNSVNKQYRSLYSDRYLNETRSDFCRDIDAAIESAGLSREEFERLGQEYQASEYDRGRLQEEIAQKALPVYRQLRIIGYSHFDLYV